MAKASTALDRIRQLDEERNRILADAKGEAMAHANEALASLNSLGFNYRITEVGQYRAAPSGGRKGTRQVNPERMCPICGFQTVPPHDARAHRGQTEKHAFTASELSERGMQKA